MDRRRLCQQMPGALDLFAALVGPLNRNEHTASMVAPAQDVDHKVKQRLKRE